MNAPEGVVRACKLPRQSVREEYALEYGTDALEMHADALPLGTRTLIVDDVLATGGTAAAVVRLVKRAGGKPIGVLLLADRRARRIGESDRRLIELWGAQAAVSIVNSRLYQHMDEAIRSLRHVQAQRDTL